MTGENLLAQTSKVEHMEHSYTAYIMSSHSGVLYIGSTSELANRVQQHKNGEFEGFTKKYKCTRLVYYETYGDVRAAIGRERILKGWSRAKKIALIESVNPKWQDLSASWGREFLVQRQSMKEADEARRRRKVLRLPE
jgi:putative endonuclease